MEKQNKSSGILLSLVKSILFIALMVVGIAVAKGIFGQLQSSDELGEAARITFLYAGVLAFLIASAKFIFKHSMVDYFGKMNYSTRALWCLAGVGIALGISLFTELGTYLVAYEVTTNGEFAVEVFLLTITWITLRSVIEEFVFRGFVLSEFKQYNSRPLLAVIVFLTAILSATIYYLISGCDPLSFVTYALFAIGLSLLYLGTGNIWLSVSVHATWTIIHSCLYMAREFTYLTNTQFISDAAVLQFVEFPADGTVTVWNYDVPVEIFNNIITILAAAMIVIVGLMFMQKSREKAIADAELAKKRAIRAARKAAEKVAKQEAAEKEAEKLALKETALKTETVENKQTEE